MFTFRYEAIDRKKKKVTGTLRASSEQDAVKKIERSHLEIIQLEPAPGRMSLREKLKEIWSDTFERIGEYPVILFTKELSLMLKVGIPIDQAFQTLAKYQDHAGMRKVVGTVREDVRSGVIFSHSLRKHPKVFLPVYKALVEVGEATGKLGEILGELSTYLDHEYNTRKRIYAALTYPVFVMGFTIVILTGLMAYYIPSFIKFLEGMHIRLPLTTRILMLMVNFFKNPLAVTILVVCIVILMFLYYNYTRTLIGRYHIDKIKMGVPVIGEILVMVNMARFARTSALMYRCGIGITTIMELCKQVVDVVPLQELFDECKDEIREGASLGDAMRRKEYITPLIASFLTMADETGDVEAALGKISELYNSHVEYKIDSMISLIEPLFMGIVATVVGFVALSLFLPIYSVISTMGT